YRFMVASDNERFGTNNAVCHLLSCHMPEMLMSDLVIKAFTLLISVIVVICLSLYLEIPPKDVLESITNTRSVSFQASLSVDFTVQVQI
ncbi:hypothetical protein, partial [Vibrio parahaemolyticus]|uniref:hypothetical protein n=1 Tax=Vibrio parahaemolyticus TaxID=670 RepID=UPI00387B3E7A